MHTFYLKSHLKNLEKEDQSKLKTSINKEIKKIRKGTESKGIYKRKKENQ